MSSRLPLRFFRLSTSLIRRRSIQWREYACRIQSRRHRATILQNLECCMNAPDLGSIPPAWLARLADPEVWQEWSKLQQLQRAPKQAADDLSKLIDPAV